MSLRVHVTDEAEKDLLDIWEPVELNDVPGKADDPFDRLEQTCATLAHLPAKGHIPPELRRVGVDLYREIHFKPYRIIYRVVDSSKSVYIYLICDGRRDMQTLLKRRLLHA